MLPPAISGQMALFDASRVLSRETLRRLGQRQLQGYDRAAAEAAVFAAEYGFARSWVTTACELLKLALVCTVIQDEDDGVIHGEDVRA